MAQRKVTTLQLNSEDQSSGPQQLWKSRGEVEMKFQNVVANQISEVTELGIQRESTST